LGVCVIDCGISLVGILQSGLGGFDLVVDVSASGVTLVLLLILVVPLNCETEEPHLGLLLRVLLFVLVWILLLGLLFSRAGGIALLATHAVEHKLLLLGLLFLASLLVLGLLFVLLCISFLLELAVIGAKGFLFC